jgi:hypothetical protein
MILDTTLVPEDGPGLGKAWQQLIGVTPMSLAWAIERDRREERRGGKKRNIT